MPLSEFHRAATREKLEPPQSKMSNCTSDVSSFMPDHDFVELLWENGQIVMQGQSNRPKKTSFPSNSLRVNEKDGREPTNQKFGQFEPIDSTVNDFSPAVPCANIGLNTQDDDMVPWISNYPIEDPFSSEFFSELAGINPNSPLIERNSGSNLKDLHNVEHGQTPCRARTNNSFQSSQQCQSSVMNTTKSRLNEFGNGGSSSGSAQQAQLLKQDLVSSSKPLHLSGGFGLMNFSHFARPVALAKANMESSDRLRSNEKTLSKDSTLGESYAKTGGKLISTEPSEAIRHEDGSKNNHHNNGKLPENQINHQSSSFDASIALGKKEAEKKPEAVVASSVCSGNSAGAASNDPKNRGKRKNREGEESGYQSEDLDDESFGVKKPTMGRGGMSTKRSRAAEVHNLSERRRRDRINEKMRALQELIPNCNKVDKASMLDEAIEYLKTLQLQVQMMSMGNGLCMSPMMLPPGMQHLRAPPMAHFSPMGLGMGMGMGLGYGMGMLDMNGSPNCPLIPVPMHTSQFPGATGLQLFGMTGSGQGLPMSMPRAPLPFTPLSNLTPKGNSVNEVGGTMGNPLPVSDTSRSAQQQCINLEAIKKPSGNEQKLAKESLDTSHLSASNRKS